MESLGTNLWIADFSHIYIEKDIINHKNTEKILSRFTSSKIIYIDNYKDVFNRSGQNFSCQKESTKLILARKRDNYIYRGARVCQDFGNDNFYYTSSVMNCIYNCDYCYLQGMYPSANIVIFVNLEDTFMEIEKILEKDSIYLCISYDTDLLALEGITGFVKQWVEFAEKHSNIKIELRTKSSNLASSL